MKWRIMCIYLRVSVYICVHVRGQGDSGDLAAIYEQFMRLFPFSF